MARVECPEPGSQLTLESTTAPRVLLERPSPYCQICGGVRLQPGVGYGINPMAVCRCHYCPHCRTWNR